MPLYRNPDFRRLPEGLGKIFARRAQSGFFARPEWYDLMARDGSGRDGEVRVYSDERPGSEAALLLHWADPAAGCELASLANYYSVEHAILSARGADPGRGLDAILAEIAAERPAWDRLALGEFNPREPGWEAALAALRRAGFLVSCGFRSGTWYEETAGLGFAEYLAQRPSELRNTWRRRRRKAEAGGRLGRAFFAGPADIERAIADYETIYAASWKPPEPFPRFIPGLIRTAAEAGALRLGIYTVDGVPAAAQVWIVEDGRAVIYKLAHDKRFDDLSLGTLLTMEMIERALTLDRPAEINFGRGDDPYKKAWLPRRRERWGIVAANPRTVRGLGLGLRGGAASIYRRLRGRPIAPAR
jgi:Acetyltransferase (GNAT) domain